MKVFPDTLDNDSIEIEIRGDRRRVGAFSITHEQILIHGLAVRYPTGKKVWPGRAIYWKDSGDVNNLRATNIDHRTGSGFVLLVGYFADYADKAVRSNHSAVA